VPPVVVIYRPVAGAETSHETLRAAGCDVIVEPIDLPGSELREAVRAADVLMGATFRGGIIDAAWLDRFPRLRLISKYTIGFDDVDLAAATARGVAVTHCPTEANWGGVAEGTMAMMLAVLKRVRERDTAVRSGRWRDPSLEGRYLGSRDDGYGGLTIGIVGLGRVGTRLAQLLRPWKATVIACDPYVSQAAFEAAGARRVDLETLLRQADVVSIHCALTAETRNLIDESALAQMKRGAILINTARGAIVDLDALLAGLDEGRPAQAALDVFPVEPVRNGAELMACGDRLLLSPHMVAANAGGTLLAAVPWATQAACDALEGRVPQRLVNPEVSRTWLKRFGGKPLLQTRMPAL
jgi:phosphoglycerate dehydrogenase-like enzyme